jgi:hypothetical protein
MTTSTRPAPAAGWLTQVAERGYYYRQIAALTIGMGTYFHLTRLLLGDDDLTIAHVFTPTFDRTLTIPMTYAAVAGVLARRRFAGMGRGRRLAYWASWFYIAASVPMHIAFAYAQNLTEYLRAFPLWFSYLLLPVYAAMLWFWWRLPLRAPRAD